jgi:hypothetical protein
MTKACIKKCLYLYHCLFIMDCYPYIGLAQCPCVATGIKRIINKIVMNYIIV